MHIETVKHYRVVGPHNAVNVYGDGLVVEASIQYARALIGGGMMVQAIKFLRGNLNLGLREAHAIATDIRIEVRGERE